MPTYLRKTARRGLVSISVAALALSSGLVPGAHAATDCGTGWSISGGKICWDHSGGTGGGGGSGGGGGGSSTRRTRFTQSPIRWVTTWYGEFYPCTDEDATDGDTNGDGEITDGRVFVRQGFYRATGEPVPDSWEEFCVPDRRPTPPPPADPPSPSTIWNRQIEGNTAIGAAAITADFHGDALTQLPSRFSIPPIEIPPIDRVDINGYTVTATVSVTGYHWTANGTPIGTSSPSIDHTFLRKGDFTVAVRVTFSGTYTITGNGISITGDFTPPDLVVAESYHVVEIRGGLLKQQ